MGKYRFNQSRRVTTVEMTSIDIEARSYEEAVEMAEELTPFSEHDGAIEEDYDVVSVILDEDMAIEVAPEDNNGEATVETYFGDKLVFDNTPKEESLNARIKRIMNEGMLGAFYISMGVEYMKRCLDQKTDEDILNEFGGLFAPGSVKNNVDYIHKQLFPDQYKS